MKDKVTAQEMLDALDAKPEYFAMHQWQNCLAGVAMRCAGWKHYYGYHFEDPSGIIDDKPSAAGDLPSMLLNVDCYSCLFFMGRWPWNEGVEDDVIRNMPQEEQIQQAKRAIKYYMLSAES